MDLIELANKLSDMYNNAPKGDSVAMIHLFGINYAEQIKRNSKIEIIHKAGLPSSYLIELSKGVKLSKYVISKAYPIKNEDNNYSTHIKTKSKGYILNKFEKYLEDNNYSKITPSGKPSTTNDYSKKRIPKILDRENISISILVENIEFYIKKYDFGGEETSYGNKSNRAFINALKRFGEFIKSTSISKEF